MRRIYSIVTSFFMIFIVACGGNQPSEICNNTIDDDQNGFADCLDASCQNDPACQNNTPEICNNNQDDDADGAVDCLDLDCQSDPNCQPEICDNQIDDNQNGQIDCNDPACQSSATCQEVGNCQDGIDNDQDGNIDCDDVDCQNDAACLVELCNNNLDDDQDGFVDCLDSDCQNDPICQEAGNCEDGVDNDLDALFDCIDPDCANDIACLIELCDNGIDDDLDGNIDCADDDCQNDQNCQEGLNCQDGIDNDQDGNIDCDDDDCANQAVCLPEICDNGIDDDLDGNIDCTDDECAGGALCVSFCDNALPVNDPSTQTGDNTGQPNISDGTCQSSGGSDIVFQLIPVSDALLTLNLSSPNTDLGVFVQTICGDPFSEIGCIDDNGAGNESLTISVTGGVPLFIFVGGFFSGAEGPFTLEIQSELPEICDNGIDDNQNGLIDCDDTQCQNDPICIALFCQTPIIANDPSTQTGDNTGQPNISDGACQDFDTADVLFEVTPINDGFLNLALTSSADLGISVQTICGDPFSEIDCVDDDLGFNFTETLTIPVSAGVPLFVLASGFEPGEEGPFTLEIQSFAIGPEICDNGVDDDQDFLTDCDDSDCAAEIVCQPEICDNGIDDNQNGLIDCDDSDCFSDPICVALFCQAPIIANDPSTQFGDNTGQPNISDSFCQDIDTADVLFEVTPINDGFLNLALTSDADLGISVQTICGDPNSEIDCADDDLGPNFTEVLAVPATAGVPLFVLIGGFEPGEEGPFTLEIQSSVNQIEFACNNLDDDDFDGLFDCQDPDCQSLAECQPGNLPTGEPCTAASDCAIAGSNAPFCIDEIQFGFLDGYCSEYCDLFAPVCSGADGICIDLGLGTSGLCLDQCQVDADCRPGYVCDDPTGNGTELVCVP